MRASGERVEYGRITKQGNAHVRWLLVQAAQHLDSHPGPLGHFFRRLARKKNRNVAVVAAARKIALIAYHMLKNGTTYRELGGTYFDGLDRDRVAHRLLTKLNRMGYAVMLSPSPAGVSS